MGGSVNRLNHNAGNFKTDYNYIRGADFETANPRETPYKMNGLKIWIIS